MPKLLTKEDVVGIFPPVVSPFTQDEELDLEAFKRIRSRPCRAPFNHVPEEQLERIRQALKRADSIEL